MSLQEEEVERIVRATLKNLGIDTTDPAKAQRDFIYLRQFRECVESIQSKGMLTVVTVLITGLLAIIGLGIITWLKGVGH